MLVLATALLAVAGGAATVLQRRRSLAGWAFFGGMVILAAKVVFGECARAAEGPVEQASCRSWELVAESLLPGFWLCFSLAFSRGDARESLSRFRWLLVFALVVPVGWALAFREQLVRVEALEGERESWAILSLAPAKALTVLVLLGAVGVLINLEKTFRASVGTARWRIKYVFLGMGLIFGAQIYILSQDLLFSRYNPAMATVQAAALFLGCVLLAVAFLRRGFGNLDIYPSRAALQSSLTVLVVGAYFVVVGLLAQAVALLGGIERFPAKAFLILLGIVGLAILLLSDRLRSRMQQFVTRHFKRPEHDYRRVWTETTRSLSSHVDPQRLCGAAAKLVSKTFNALSVTVFVADENRERLEAVATTSPENDGEGSIGAERSIPASPDVIGGLRTAGRPMDLERTQVDGIEPLRKAVASQFPHGGHRVVVPLIAGERLLGMMSLADRVEGVPYTQEELELLAGIADQFAASLLNLRLGEELMRARELEAFQTVSTFFVHDMKNAANSLNLMLQNLPVHFDDPEFRQDALRAIGKTVHRINELTERLGSLRKKLELEVEEADLNELVRETLEALPPSAGIEVRDDLESLPAVQIDPEQMRTVLTNLVLNAREAVGANGQVVVETARRNGSVILCVEDNGCGMSPEFIRDSLFRPFRSTKSKGLGIGMFQSRMIVEAHGGTIQVESEPGEGTRFRITLPAEG